MKVKNLFKENGIFSGKRVLALVIAATFFSGTALGAVATESTHEWKSTGNVVYNKDGDTKTVFNKKDLDYLNRKIDTAIAATNTATSDAATGKRLIATTLNTWKNGTVTNKAHPITQLVDAEDKNPPTFESINSKLEYIKSTPGVTEPYTDSDGNQLYVQADGTTTTDSTKADPNPPTGAKNPLKIAAANAGNLSAGTAAWVNGEFIIGTGSDNNNYYKVAYTKGIAEGLSKVNVSYVYHQHEGSSSTKGGCYTSPVYHSHVSSCYSNCPGVRKFVVETNGGECKYQCSVCGTIRYLGGGLKKWDNSACDISSVVCGKSTSTIIGYSLGCGKTESTIEQAIINY